MRFPMFVACGLGELQEYTDVKECHWVPSDYNMVDLDLNTISKSF